MNAREKTLDAGNKFEDFETHFWSIFAKKTRCFVQPTRVKIKLATYLEVLWQPLTAWCSGRGLYGIMTRDHCQVFNSKEMRDFTHFCGHKVEEIILNCCGEPKLPKKFKNKLSQNCQRNSNISWD
jgi:hypothetical protein